MSNEITELEVDGMTCANCAVNVENYIKKTGGEDVNVNFATKELRFKNVRNTSLEELKKGLNNIGYTLVERRDEESEGKKKMTPLEKKLLISAILTFPLLLHMFLPFPLLHDPIFQLVLCLPVMYIGTSYFGKSAWGSLKGGTANMDVLIFVGSTSAFIYSLVGTAMYWGSPEAHNFLFFETAATIITLVLLGNYIEERAVEKTSSSLQELMKLKKHKAKLIRVEAGQETTVLVEPESLMLGDLLQANTGDQIVADGILQSGSAEVDESLISGESTPVYKEEGDVLVSGSIILDGSIRYQVKQAGKKSTLSKIIELVKDAQTRKPRIQRLGDKVSSIFVPTVLSISVLTFIISVFGFDIAAKDALMAAIAVLVISCPCAMGLATPTAVMVGVGKGAKSGVLLKGGETVEKLAKIKTVVFDKTGTLTNGDFKVKNFQTWQYDETVAKNVVLHMEKASSHPIAESIQKNHPDWFMMKFEYTELKELKGKGIYAKDAGGNEFKLGKPGWFEELTEEQQEKDILLSYCGRVVAGFDIEDRLKVNAKEAVQRLRSMGIACIMLSGDNEKKCRYVAERLGIDEFYHSQLPEDKLAKLDELSKRGKLAMVGDGINDAPALSKADVGISMGSATDIAKESAEVILMKDDMAKLTEAFVLGRKTYTTIKQNLFWALAYNVVAIPIAAIGLLNPMVGALSMAFSDVIVIGNSMLLNLRKTKQAEALPLRPWKRKNLM